MLGMVDIATMHHDHVILLCSILGGGYKWQARKENWQHAGHNYRHGICCRRTWLQSKIKTSEYVVDHAEMPRQE